MSRNRGEPYVLETIKGKNPERPMSRAELYFARFFASVPLPIIGAAAGAVAARMAESPDIVTGAAAAGGALATLIVANSFINSRLPDDARRSEGHGKYVYKNED